jgi:hypothetical protein
VGSHSARQVVPRSIPQPSLSYLIPLPGTRFRKPGLANVMSFNATILGGVSNKESHHFSPFFREARPKLSGSAGAVARCPRVGEPLPRGIPGETRRVVRRQLPHRLGSPAVRFMVANSVPAVNQGLGNAVPNAGKAPLSVDKGACAPFFPVRLRLAFRYQPRYHLLLAGGQAKTGKDNSRWTSTGIRSPAWFLSSWG